MQVEGPSTRSLFRLSREKELDEVLCGAAGPKGVEVWIQQIAATALDFQEVVVGSVHEVEGSWYETTAPEGKAAGYQKTSTGFFSMHQIRAIQKARFEGVISICLWWIKESNRVSWHGRVAV